MNGTLHRATSRDVALLAKVSQSSVSRAFTPNSSLSADKRERVLRAASALNYVPNSIASSLITRRSNTIAIILGNIENPFYVHVLKGFIAKLQKLGRQTLTFTVEPGASSDDAILRVLRHQVDGIILTAAQLSTRSTSLCRDRGIPLVLFNRTIPGADAAVVRCDNVGGGAEMAQSFLAAGARSFAIIKGDPMGSTSQDRVTGFLGALWQAGIARDAVREIEGQSVYQRAFDAVGAVYGGHGDPLPAAIFGVNDIMAIGAIDALRSTRRIRVPEDVLVAGFDDIPESARWPYRLTTMRQPIEQMIHESLALLMSDDRENGAPSPVDRQLNSTMIWRETLRSSDVPASKTD